MAFEAFLAWAVDGGMHAHERLTVSLDVRTGERAMMTTGAISAGEELLRVPRTLMLMGQNTVGQNMANAYPKKEAERLAFGLLSELRAQSLGKPSFWAPYFATLPTRLSTPLFFNSTERGWLRGSELNRLLPQREAALIASHEALQLHLHRHLAAIGVGADGRAEKPFTRYDVAQVYSLMWSRSFMVKVPPSLCEVETRDGQPCRTPALVPVADLFNHAEEAEANVYMTANAEALSFFAERPLAPNEEAFIT